MYLAKLAWLTVALAQPDPVPLTARLDSKEPFYQVNTISNTQGMTVLDMEVSQTQSCTYYLHWQPQGKDREDHWQFLLRLIAVKVNVNVGGTEVSWHSWYGDPPPNPLADLFKSVVGAEYQLTLRSDRTIVKLETRKKILKLGHGNKQVWDALNSHFGEETMKEVVQPVFGLAPGKAVRPGDSWSSAATWNLGSLSTPQIQLKITYAGESATQHYLQLEMPAKALASMKTPVDATYKILSSDLRISIPKGTARFDRRAGRVVQLEREVAVEGSMQIELGGRPVRIDMRQRQKTTMETRDTRPLK
jgi:hypothetical protein